MLLGEIRFILKPRSMVLLNSTRESVRTGWDLGSSSVCSNRCLGAERRGSQLRTRVLSLRRPLHCVILPLFSSTGSLLLESLKDHISTTAQDHCKAIYLHVLTTNNTAINFYENRDFKQHHYLPYYYSIRGVLKDGFTYVLYINGGHPPWTILYPLPSR